LTPLLVFPVLHTQIANVAVWPDLTSPELEKDSIRTQSCGALWVGGDFVELGEGVGLGDLLDVLGDGEGDTGLEEPSVGGDELLEGDFASEPDALGVDEGLTLLDDAEALGDAEVESLGDAAFLLVADPLGDADLPLLALAEPPGKADLLLPADLLGDAEAGADSLSLWLRGPMIAAVSAAFFGGDEHVL